MMAQFGVRQLIGEVPLDPVYSLGPIETGLHSGLVIFVEIVCSFFIMIGLFTRIMIIPPFVLMIVASHEILMMTGNLTTSTVSMLCVPFLFMGVYFFMLLVGPGKISVDYFFSLYLISKHHNGQEEDLEEV